MSKNLQLPGALKAGGSFPNVYPLADVGIGFDNVESDSYGQGSANTRIFPVAHPFGGARPVAVRFDLHPGDRQPHYQGSGERTEIWSEPHDGVDGVSEAICVSYVFPKGFQTSKGWGLVLQNHIGEDDTSAPDEGGASTGIDVVNGVINFSRRFHGKTPFGPLQTDRELFVQMDCKHASGGDGHVTYRVAWDAPPAADATPFMTWVDKTQFGSRMYWKVGYYRNAEAFPATVFVTSFARRDTIAQARSAAGWGSVVTPPPVDPPPAPTIHQSIEEGSTIKGTVLWLAATTDDSQVQQVEFLVDGNVVHTELDPPYGNGDPPSSDAGSYDTHKLSEGAHVLSARAQLSGGGNVRVDAHVTVANGVPAGPLRKIAEDAKTITLGWDAVPNAYGYRFFADGHPVSWTADHTRTSVKFAKGAAEYKVLVLLAGDTLTYRP